MSTTNVSITWLGHATFLFRLADGRTLLVDPFVASNPACPATHHDLDRLDYVAITHGHEDHVADAVGLCKEHGPRTAAMVEIAGWLQSEGVDPDTLVAMNKGGRVALGDIDVTMVNAEHSSTITTAAGPITGGEAAGLVLDFPGGPTVYHAGDTCVFGDMRLIGELYSPDIALLPIGDTFTMGPREAALAVELLGVPRVLPMHYGTWPVLTGTPEQLAAECVERGVEVEIIHLQPGETLA